MTAYHWDLVYQTGSSPINILFGQWTNSNTPMYTGQFDSSTYTEANFDNIPDGATWITPTGNASAPGPSILGSGGPYDLSTIPTGTAGYTLYQLPYSNNGVLITDVIIRCGTTMTGTTQTYQLQIGTVTGSYGELLGSAGYTFNCAAATSLLTAGQVIRGTDLVPVVTASVAPFGVITGSLNYIIAQFTGTTNFATGSIYITLLGYLL